MFYFEETVLDRPDPCPLSAEPVSLNFFNRRLTEDGWMVLSNFVTDQLFSS